MKVPWIVILISWIVLLSAEVHQNDMWTIMDEYICMNYTSAISQLEQLPINDACTTSDMYYYEYSLCYYELGKPDSALFYINKAMSYGPTEVFAQQRYKIEKQMGLSTSAKKDSLWIEKKAKKYLDSKVDWYYQTNRFDKAISQLKKENIKYYPQAILLCSQLLCIKGEYAASLDAIKRYEIAIQNEQMNIDGKVDTLNVSAQLQKCIVSYLSGHEEDALDMYRRTIKDIPEKYRNPEVQCRRYSIIKEERAIIHKLDELSKS